MSTFTYIFSHEHEVGEEVIEEEYQVKFTYTPGRPAVMYLRNGDPGYPAEGPEIEVQDIVVNYGDNIWVTVPGGGEFDRVHDLAMDQHFDDMCQAAEESRHEM